MIRSGELADNELLRLVRAGDEEAFRTLYRRCQGPIYRFALRMSGSTAIAEDVTQEVFLTLIEESSRFDATRGTLGAYLFGIGRNLVLRRLERESNFVALPEAEASGNGRNGSNGHRPSLVVAPVDPVKSEAMERVRGAILSLPANYREVVVLCDLQEQSYEEAAKLLECAVGTVRSRLHRARGLLMEKLRDLRNPRSKPVAGGQT